MASLNKVILSPREIADMYVSEKMSIPEISEKTGYALSTIRFRLKKLGVLRTRKESLILAGSKGKLSAGKGKKRTFSTKWKENLKASLIRRGELYSKGMSVKKDGYIEYTRGENKYRSVHVVAMEKNIGRKLNSNEVVHHIDGNKSNTDLSNLALMTRSEHARLHAIEANKTRRRNERGQDL